MMDPTIITGRVLNVALAAAYGVVVVITTWAGIVIMILSPTGSAV